MVHNRLLSTSQPGDAKAVKAESLTVRSGSLSELLAQTSAGEFRTAKDKPALAGLILIVLQPYGAQIVSDQPLAPGFRKLLESVVEPTLIRCDRCGTFSATTEEVGRPWDLALVDLICEACRIEERDGIREPEPESFVSLSCHGSEALVSGSFRAEGRFEE